MKIHRNIKIGQHNYKIFANKNQINKKQKLDISHFPKKIKIWPNYQKQITFRKNVSQIKFTKLKNCNERSVCCNLLAQNKSMHSNPELLPKF